MKRIERHLKNLVILTLAVTLSIPTAASAQGHGYGKDKEKKGPKEKFQTEFALDKETLLQEREALEAAKDALEAEKDALEADLEAAEEAGDPETAAVLRESFMAKKREMEALKDRMRDMSLSARIAARRLYSDEELLQIEALREALSAKFKNIRTLPVESVLARGRQLKFDTPPVIKDGRILIPVRAVSEAFGAQVAWDPDTKTVTVVRGETILTLEIGSFTATVNGEEAPLDVPSELMNGRTVIPLRFVVESLGLSVEWETETETAVIEDGDDAELEEPQQEDPAGEASPEEAPAAGGTATGTALESTIL